MVKGISYLLFVVSFNIIIAVMKKALRIIVSIILKVDKSRIKKSSIII